MENRPVIGFDRYIDALRGKSVAFVGFGVSNRPLARLFAKAGAHVAVYDRQDVELLGEEARALAASGVSFVSCRDFCSIKGDLVFRSPGIRPDRIDLPAGSVPTSEMEAFFQVCPCPIYAVTGSDGKTTTTTLVAKLLSEAGKRVHLGGNIGTPLFPEAGGMRGDDRAVVELSSFQLMTMTGAPDRAVVTNLSPNHLDIHTDMEEYVEAKKNIFKNMKSGRVVLNLDNEITRSFLPELPSGVTPVGFTRQGRSEGVEERFLFREGVIFRARGREEEAILAASDILLPGLHNVENYMAAIGAAGDEVSASDIRAVATSFGGVENRLELVRIFEGVRYYNSSIDSSPTRTAAALSVFDKPVVAILGGYDKHLPFDSLGPVTREHCAAAVLLGATAGRIREAIDGQGFPVVETESMEEAVSTARRLARELSSGVVLLSPACASFDLFKNFEERGAVFKKAVADLGEGL